jgi:hypothetical protein
MPDRLDAVEADTVGRVQVWTLLSRTFDPVLGLVSVGSTRSTGSNGTSSTY